jgi:hypothetical protein
VPTVGRSNHGITNGVYTMNRFSLLVSVLCATALLVGVADAQKVSDRPVDTLEGVLRVHPKFYYRYYIDGFGDGQECALFAADKRLQQIKPGSLIRVRGDLASKFFGQKDKTSALISTWIIYMNVDQVEVLRAPVSQSRMPSSTFPRPSQRSKRAEVAAVKSAAPVPPSSMTRPIGLLGLPIGTYVRIEGHPYRPTKPPFKVHARTLLVDTLQGKKLNAPIKLVMMNIGSDSLSTETRCVLNGYESGAWVGSPEGLPPGTPVEQAVFHFHHYFVVTSVEEPKGLKVR